MTRFSFAARAVIKLSLLLSGLAFATTAQAQCSRATLQKLSLLRRHGLPNIT